MNFGKNSTQKKRKQLSSASSKRGKQAGVTFLRILFLSFAAVCVIFCCMGIGAFRAILDTAPDISSETVRSQCQPYVGIDQQDSAEYATCNRCHRG